MTTNRVSNVENTLRATGAVLGLLPQIAGLIVGFTSLAYIIGWSEASSYYSELGAPWATSLLTPTQVMQTSISLISIIAIVTFVSVVGLVEQTAGVKGLRRWSIIFLILAAIAYASSFVLDNRASASVLVIISSILWAVSTGTTMGELIGCLALQGIRWGGYEVYLLYFIIFYGLSQAPGVMGKSRAHLVTDSYSTSLPKVTLVGTTPDMWRLVGPCGDKFLLISLEQEQKGRLFKLVASESITLIHAAEQKK
ncbi:TPA: hypothetical protein SMJ97_002998 [Klebsiella oxytoca]|nr:hypothetical protein [Klebsiella oxytoca]HEJ8586997.1 hypothetical protein [Klebsiella oxytoca]